MKTRMIFLTLVIASLVTVQLAVTRAAVATHNTSRGGWAGITMLTGLTGLTGRTGRTGRTEGAIRSNRSLNTQLQTDAKTLDFTTVSVCDSCSTQPIGISNKGVITGGYFDAGGNPHGFLLTRSGSYVTIDVPGGALFVEAGRSTGSGYVAGDYVAEDGIDRPFVRNPNGSFDLRQGFAGASVTYAIDINSRGDLAGSYTLDPEAANGFTGYVMRGSSFISTFSYPGANVTNTYVLGQNESGAIVGSYKTTTADEEHAFLRTAHGKFRRIDYPGSVQTEAFGINDAGDIVGRYLDSNGVNHGFLLSDGDFTTFDAAGPNTFAWGINSKGNIVGWAFPTASDGFVGFKLLKAN
jgi:probable HAF family extracellular repeat protein